MIRRREFLMSSLFPAALSAQKPVTRFQIACMTLPYSAFPLERALSGLKRSGYEYVAWGVNHKEADGKSKPVMAVDAPAAEAAKLAARCRDIGLEPVMMFSTVNLEAKEAGSAHAKRIEQAAAAKIPFLLTFGKTTGGEYDTVIRNLKEMGPLA
ncbi:MAG: hypothetical protein ACRD7E_17455, partial [Bryobacteraceae bacterium]